MDPSEDTNHQIPTLTRGVRRDAEGASQSMLQARCADVAQVTKPSRSTLHA